MVIFSKMEKEKNALLKRTDEVFAETPPPGDDHVFVKLHKGDVDYDELDYTDFHGLHWKNLTLEFLLRFDIKAILSYFTPEAFKFYLPGIMRIIILNPKKTEEEGIRDALVCSMTPVVKENDQNEANSDSLNVSKKELIGSFAKNQLEVFRSFLEFMSSYCPSSMTEDYALEVYWREHGI